jgi:glucose/arabinose dehydrogenase
MGIRALAAAAVVLLLLTGCSGPAAPKPSASAGAGGVTPIGQPKELASGLQAPWSVVRLPSGSALISERDAGQVLELTAKGNIRSVGVVSGSVHQGEGGLLGLAVKTVDGVTWLYAYTTTATDNRIVRMPLRGSAGGYSLGEQQPILTGLAKAANHDGGRIAFGPDGKLYATVGDAGVPARAQDDNSLNGKILRMNADGTVPKSNPFPRSLIYSMGHRNPQGLAWDSNRQLWAAEFGQDSWDELNRIRAGANYGWPIVEGIAKRPGFVDPVHQWTTSEASPSGLAYVGGTFFVAALRGQRIWTVHTGSTIEVTSWFDGRYGRIRDAVPGPHGTLWILTNNTDGRGDPEKGDDRLLQVKLGALREG